MRRQNFQKGLRKQLPRKSGMSLLPRTHENAGHGVAHRQPQPWAVVTGDSCGLPALPACLVNSASKRDASSKKKEKEDGQCPRDATGHQRLLCFCRLASHTPVPHPYTYTCPHMLTHILKNRQLLQGTGKKTFKPVED